MKSIRHDMILDIIAKEKIQTQEELRDNLLKRGFDVTQATISRDIKNLRLIKKRTGPISFYAILEGIDDRDSGDMSPIFSEAVTSIIAVNNIIVVKCKPGMANAACAAFDNMETAKVIGTLSGDDTFIIIVDKDISASNLSKKLLEYIEE